VKITRFGALLFSLMLPMSVAAQTAAAQADAPANVDPARVYGNMIRTAERAIVGLAEAMPEDKYSFAPAAGLFAAGQTTEFKGVRTFELTPQPGGSTAFVMQECFSGLMLPLVGRLMPDMGPVFERYAADLKHEAEHAHASR